MRTTTCAALFLAIAVRVPMLTTTDSSLLVAALITTQNLTNLAHLVWAWCVHVFTLHALMSGGIVAGEVTTLKRIPNITRFLSCRAVAEGSLLQGAAIIFLFDTGSFGENEARP